jgi:hypothetical protein
VLTACLRLAGRCSIILGITSWLRQAAITSRRCSGKSLAVLLIIARMLLLEDEMTSSLNRSSTPVEKDSGLGTKYQNRPQSVS